MSEKKLFKLKQAIGDRRALFFDIDGTIFVKQLTIELMLACGRRFHSKRKVLEHMREHLQNYRMHRTYDFQPVVEAAVSAIPEFFSDLPEDTVLQIARQIIRGVGGETYLFPRIVLEGYSTKHLSARGLIVAITGAPQEIAELFCKRLGFDLVFGVRYEIVNGRYTGVRDDRTVHAKGKVVEEVAERFRLNLHRSVAFGDTLSDLPMLLNVGHGFAVNPHRQLLQVIPKLDDPKHVIWINDRQKNGVTFLQWQTRSKRFVQVQQNSVVPSFMGTPQLPGPPIGPTS